MSDQGKTYATFIEAEMKHEYDRRAALDTRALSVVTSSSALLTLVFVLVAVVSGKDYTVRGTAAAFVLVALVCFLVAGLLGIVANRAREYEVTAASTLIEMLRGHWTDDEVDARNTCAERNVVTIRSLRRGNNSKARQITAALVFQVAAITALAVALFTDLR